jgi:hypothetical protein
MGPRPCGELVTWIPRWRMSNGGAHPSPRSTEHRIAHKSRLGNTGSPYARFVAPVDPTSELSCEPGIALEGRFSNPVAPSKGTKGAVERPHVDKFVDKYCKSSHK